VTAADLRSIPLVFVEDLGSPALDDRDHRHLTRSLRLSPGAPIALADGAGRWRSARLGSNATPSDLGSVLDADFGRPSTTVGFALTKGDRTELVIQKLTELGVGRIVPMTTERTVVRWDRPKATRNQERHVRIAREAAMQSRNLWLPEVWPVTSLQDVISRIPEAAVAEPGAPVPGLDPSTPMPAAVLVGPEGGFSPDERGGLPTVGLPGNILRSETAAIVAGVILTLTASRG
jgi:16S rRNA (uracil1498-N3)-methyltransferase